MSTQAAELQQKMADFLAAGGSVTTVPGFERIALRPAHRDAVAVPAARPRRATSRRPVEYTQAEQALIKALAPLKSITEVSRTTGISRSALERFAFVEGFTFKSGKGQGREALEKSQISPERLQSLVERIRAFQSLGLTRAQTASRSGAGKRLFMQICREHNINWPAAGEGS